MKTSQILNENSSQIATVQQLWQQMQDNMTSIKDELYDLVDDPKYSIIAQNMLTAMSNHDMQTFHKLIKKLY